MRCARSAPRWLTVKTMLRASLGISSAIDCGSLQRGELESCKHCSLELQQYVKSGTRGVLKGTSRGDLTWFSAEITTPISLHLTTLTTPTT